MDEQSNSSIQQAGTIRRRFIGLTLLGSLVVTVGGVLSPIIAYLLGCIAYWHERRRLIQCPCHDGRFNPLNGNVILGPPPAPLAEYRLQVKGGAVYVEPGGGA